MDQKIPVKNASTYLESTHESVSMVCKNLCSQQDINNQNRVNEPVGLGSRAHNARPKRGKYI